MIRGIAFLDLEGTLLKSDICVPGGEHFKSQWQAIALSLGSDAVKAEQETQRKWNDNLYTGYLAWVEATCEIHKQFGLSRQLLQTLVNSAELMPGAQKLVDYLHSAGFKTTLVTGAVKAFADRVQRELGLHHSLAACEYFFDDKGNLDSWNTLPSDFKGKRNFMDVVVHEYGVRSADCLFIGDGKNDVELAKGVGLSVCFNGHADLAAVSTIVINQDNGDENLDAIIPELEKHL